ncbi:sensor histidine kinase [Xanthomonas sp. 60]
MPDIRQAPFRSTLELACAVSGMRVALLGRVDATTYEAMHVLDRSGLGLSAGLKLDLATTFCRDVCARREPVAFGDHAVDAQLRDSPIPALYGFRSYISVPVVLGDGSVYGTLCTLDPAVREVTEDMVRMITTLSGLVATQIDGLLARQHDRVNAQNGSAGPTASQQQLQALESNNAELLRERRQREEFIAVLAHDLRNPLQTIRVTSELLSFSATAPAQQNLLRHVEDSTQRIAELIDTTLDFARGRLGAGVALRLQPWTDLAGILVRACEQALLPYPETPLQVDAMALPQVVTCDADRLCQLVSNLVINAAIHGQRGEPIRLRGHCTDDALELHLSNAGSMSNETLAVLFEPFHRTPAQRLDSGLGLGLYIASEIARAHEGELSVTSNVVDGTCFTLRLPLPA